MTTPTARKLYVILCGNAALLGLVLLSLWTRGGAAPAGAQVAAPPTAAAGNGMTIMPAQLAPNVYGCYLLDADRQSLCVYSFTPGTHDLHLEAGRDVSFDRAIKRYNTTPPPADVQRLEARFAQPSRTVPPKE